MDGVNKVFHFEAPREHYVADAAVVWCFDHRFHAGFEKFLKRNGAVRTDVIKIAGGAKSLVSPEREADRAFVLDQIEKSIRLHATKRVILMVHSDCGAYGGLAVFGNNPSREAVHHAGELRRAAKYVRDCIPGVEVEAYLVDFEGVWQVDVSGSALADA
jgi:carbonic anhydrase